MDKPSEAAKPKGSAKIQLLEGMRGLAAVYVFIGHLFLERFGFRDTKFAPLFQFGQEAVMVFFLLSGFVIYYSVANKPKIAFGEYFRKRFLRIYPIYVLALVLTLFLTPKNGELWANLLMLQDFKTAKPGVWFATLGGNSALWSLSYEWWFYMLFFPIYRFVPDAKQRVVAYSLAAAGLALYVVVPNQISLFLAYFAIWWTGVEIARANRRGERLSLARQWPGVAMLAASSAVFLVWTAVAKGQGQPIKLGFHPFLEARHFGSALAIVVVASMVSAKGKAGLDRVLRPFTKLAPASYAIYVLHMPLVVHAAYLDFLPAAVALPAYAAVLFIVSFVVEGPVQTWVNGLVPGRKRTAVARV
ncbi:MAG: acyltransferase [Fimbriimonadaceae bacterium]|nr:acyltransferase [Fimbriimonadaceae bacterium]